MLKRSILTGIAIMSLAVLPACFLSPEDSKGKPEDPPPPFEDLTQKEHVLINLQRAYNQRVYNEYNKLLDADFVFFFDLGDVGGNGGTIPEQWTREAELNATANMFNPNYTGSPHPITAIDLTLDGLSNLVWVPMQPQDPKFAGETWYFTTVPYNFNIQAQPDITYIQSGNPKAQYTVRSIDIDGTTYWRLVQWRDIAGS